VKSILEPGSGGQLASAAGVFPQKRPTPTLEFFSFILHRAIQKRPLGAEMAQFW
jgi:hypothetical protein